MENTQRSVTGKRLYSAVQPTNALTIGNYIGAIRNMVALQDEYDCTYAIANMHAITVRQQPAQLRANTLSVLALYLACALIPIYFFSCHAAADQPLHLPVLAEICTAGRFSRRHAAQHKRKERPDRVNVRAAIQSFSRSLFRGCKTNGTVTLFQRLGVRRILRVVKIDQTDRALVY